MNDNKKADLLMDNRYPVSEDAFAELTVWRLSEPLPGSRHRFKYSLALVVNGTCVLRYDNEQGKGDHRHVRATESQYEFVSVEQLEVDFWTDVNEEIGQ